MAETAMSRSASVLKTRGGSSSSLDDPYSGFDTSEFDHAYDLEVFRQCTLHRLHPTSISERLQRPGVRRGSSPLQLWTETRE